MNFIPLTKPDIQDEDINNVVSVLRSGMLVQGEMVKRLESDVSAFLNTPYVSAVSNGTATLHLALKVLNIGPGDEVIVPAFSFVATANVVELVGAKPVFVDIDISTFNIDVNKIEAAITKKTRAIIPVHEFGLMADIQAILSISQKYSIAIIEDAACALGAQLNGKYAGTFGDFGSFSLHPRKAITSGEGGLLVSRNSNQFHLVNSLRNHGIHVENQKMEFENAGFNYRMTDIQASLIIGQLPRLVQIINAKRKLAAQYFEEIKNQHITLPIYGSETHTWQTFHVLISDKLNRDEIIKYLASQNIGTNYGAQCIPAMKFYKRKYDLDCKLLFPNALYAYENGLALPIYEKLCASDISYISEKINTI